MISEYKLNDKEILLQSDIAGEFPVYIYLSSDKKNLFYSKNIVQLLDDKRIKKPLKVSIKAVSFILQSGVVPPPLSIYEDIFILGIGHSASICTKNNKIDISFKYDFPFFNKNRVSKDEMTPKKDEILDLIANATIKRINPSKPTFLFHSAGKDSNTIAVALAKAGLQNNITLVTHKSKGNKDESEISKSIADKLGFKHKILNEVDELKDEHVNAIDKYFTNAPFPCADNVTLVYPLYTVQMPELANSNIIDGMGNDVYIGHIPSSSENKYQKYSKTLTYIRPLIKFANSENMLNIIGRTRTEWTGLDGMSFSDVNYFLPLATDVFHYWKEKSSKKNYLDFRADIRGGMIDQEMFTRKVRNFSDSISSNLILPFCNTEVANYFAITPEEYVFDRKNLKNKLILREILNDEICLDSDKLGKMGFTYDYISVVSQNYRLLSEEIFKCKLWDSEAIKKVVNRMRKSSNGKGWSSRAASRFIYRLYLISTWLNKNKWV